MRTTGMFSLMLPEGGTTWLAYAETSVDLLDQANVRLQLFRPDEEGCWSWFASYVLRQNRIRPGFDVFDISGTKPAFLHRGGSDEFDQIDMEYDETVTAEQAVLDLLSAWGAEISGVELDDVVAVDDQVDAGGAAIDVYVSKGPFLFENAR